MTLVGVAARNILRNKFRAVLTVMGVAVAILTFILLRTVLYAWTYSADVAAKDRVVTRNKVTFIMPLPGRYLQQVKATNGVKNATFANWFGGKDPNNEKDFFASFAVEGPNYFDVYDEMKVPDDQMEAWKADKQGVIVGEVLAKKRGWDIGTEIILESGIYPSTADEPWTFRVRGIYTATAKSVDKSSFIFHYAYLNENIPESRRDQIGWIVSRVNDPSRAADISVEIDKVFDVQDIQTLSQDERSFNASFLAMFSAILTAMDIVSVVILAIMLLILGNTIAMGVRERTNEYGVLRAIGFLPRHLAIFIIGESMLIAAIGGATGVLISYPLIQQGLGRFIEENMGAYFPYFRIPPSAMIAAMGLALALGLVAAIVPALGASRLKVTEALRRVA